MPSTDRFDVAIVGAGSSGCVLAARLSEDTSRSVLLLEDGPAAAGRAELLVERVAGQPLRPYFVGRGLGGSSAVNAMLSSPPDEPTAIPLTRAQPSDWGSIDKALVEAAGASSALLTRDRGRVTASDAYLAPAIGRSNLTVRSESAVRRVVLDGTRAVGVETSSGEIIDAAEVIVAAGAIGSPVLLLRSGVQRWAIGRGLRDHPTAMVVLQLTAPPDRNGLVATTMWRRDDVQVIPLNYLDEGPYGALVAGLMTSHSQGSVELIDDQPIVRFNLLADDRDRVRLRTAARWMVDITLTGPFRRLGRAVDLPDMADDAALDRWLLARTGDYYHASCSCRTGAVDDETSVVDEAGQVHGYRGLRVCDASTFAELPTVNIHIPVVAQAERIARAIRDE